MAAAGNLIVVSAPSGAGKTSLVHALIGRFDGIAASVSHTTRPRRERETDGEDYYFVAPKEFHAMVAAGEFLEHAEVFGNFYGTSTEQIQRALDRGIDLVLEIDWQGARVVRQQYPNAISIFILPPSEAALRERLVARGRDTPEVIEARMDSARDEMSHFHEYEFLLVNDDFETALEELCTVVLASRYRTAYRHRRLSAPVAGLIASGSPI